MAVDEQKRKLWRTLKNKGCTLTESRLEVITVSQMIDILNILNEGK